MAVKFSNTCILNTTYSLFLYLLIRTEKEINNTLFIIGSGITKNIRENIENIIFIDDWVIPHSAVYRFYWKMKLLIKRNILWRFINHTHIYGHDHLAFSPMLIRNSKITVIEDGTANYNEECDGIPKVGRLRKAIINLYGRMTLEPKYGRSKYVDKIIMTGILPILPELKDKAEIIDVNKLWTASSEKKKNLILKIFNINSEELDIAKGKRILLLTQPFNEIISEKELIKIYRDVLKEYKPEEVLIKTHPRDTIDYQSILKEFSILQSPIPMELLGLLGLKFDTAITISSTAIFSLPKETEKIVLGHECSPTLLNTLGPSSSIKNKS